MTSTVSVLGITRAVLLTAVTLMNLASTTIMCLALTFGSGGRFQSILMGLNGFASLLPAAYWLHKIVFMDGHLFVRSASTFGLLSLIGFASTIIILVRNEQENGMALINDFALLSHPEAVTKAVIALGMLSTLFAVMGFLVAYMGWMSEGTEQNRVCGHSNAAQSMTARHMDNKSFHSSASTLVPGGDLDINKGQHFNVSWNDASSRSG